MLLNRVIINGRLFNFIIQCFTVAEHCFVQKIREKTHYCLIIALRVLYVNKKKLNYKLIENF